MTIKPFVNITTPGNEKAIKRGTIVPSGAVNLAWAQVPQMTPDKNVIIVDTSRIVDANNLGAATTRIYYANALGILEDENGNQIIQDEFPAVTDQFTLEGNLSGADLTAEHVLPFVHRSKYFHVDWSGLTLGSGLSPYLNKNIKVIDSHGNTYNDTNGHPRFKIKICPAYRSSSADPSPIQGSTIGNQNAYRVYVYLDTDVNEDLYLIYDKIEINLDGSLINQIINFRELLNPQPVFSYRPEETEVVDFANRQKSWYSTVPISLKDQALGLPVNNVNGYRVYVPKKAINDPRIFQLFRWRISCSFTETVKIATEVDTPLMAGVIVTNSDSTSIAAQAWNKIANSSVNKGSITITNPLVSGSTFDKSQDAYWYVNFDTISNEDLAKFNLLIWAPNAPQFDFAPYMAKIRYFTETLGCKLFIETENHMVPLNLGIQTTAGVSPSTGTQSTEGTYGVAYAGPRVQINSNVPGMFTNIQTVNPEWLWPTNQSESLYTGIFYGRLNVSSHYIKIPGNIGCIEVNRFDYDNIQYIFDFFNASSSHGWEIFDDTLISRLQSDFGASGAYTQYITSYPPNGVPLVSASIIRTPQTYTFPIVIPASTDTSTLNHNVNTTVISFYNAASMVLSGTSGTINLTVPTIPSSGVFDRTEIQQFVTFSGGTGSILATYLNGNGLNQVSHSSTITTGSNGFFAALDSVDDPTSPGSVVNLTTGFIKINSSLNLTGQNVQATVYYHIEFAVTASEPLTINTNNLVVNTPTFETVPVVIQVGNIIFSTFNILSSITSSDVAGAEQFLYNIAMFATSNRPISTFRDSSYSSSFSISSPWRFSWVINTTTNPNVLTEAEKSQFNFVFNTTNPTPVWQRQLTALTCRQEIDATLTPEQTQQIAGSSRTYYIDVTNSNVQTTSILNDDSIPYAWTWLYSPQFSVPVDFPAYIIREKEIPGDYESGQYINRTYPDKPYNCQIVSNYADDYHLGTNLTCHWSANGSATETFDTSIWVPPQGTQMPPTDPDWRPNSQEVELTWWNNSPRTYSNLNINPYKAQNIPTGIGYWQEFNYLDTSFGPGQLNWPSYGLVGQWAQGSSGNVVKFIQDFLNWYMDVGSAFQVPSGRLVVDGNYGPLTAKAVKAFQVWLTARHIDAIVDAETLSLIGGQILRYNMHSDGTPWKVFYEWPYSQMKLESISDGDSTNKFTKRSWVTNGPSVTWEIFAVQFDGNYTIHGISLTPYVEGSSSTMLFEAVHCLPNAGLDSLRGFNSEWMMVKNMNLRVADNQKTWVHIPPTLGNTIMVGVGQDSTSYPSTSRMFGVRDISALAIVAFQPGFYKTSVQQRVSIINATGTATVSTNRPVNIQAQPNYTGQGQLSQIKWNSVITDNPSVVANISPSGLITFQNQEVITQGSSGTTFGEAFPNNDIVWYSLREDGTKRPYAESGWISKADGLKLLCQADGSPVGFPAFPINVPSSERQYVSLVLTSSGSDSTVRVGFYDINQKEFIVNSTGQPELFYSDYIARGPNNIYVGVLSTYELDITESLPVFGSTLNTDDAPLLPHLLAMPVYGVSSRAGEKITLEPLPSNLSAEDLWPVLVRTGSFNRQITVPNNVTTYISPYIGSTITAFYSIPEAQYGGWSALYGEPNIDIIGEEPVLVDDNVIQVRQPPILMSPTPTSIPGPADPMVPVFTVYQKDITTSSWVTLTWDQIADYNVSTGEIFLQNTTITSDPTLFKVDYTTAHRNYMFKQYNGLSLNLNPYPEQSRTIIDKSIYIYMVPHYVTDINGTVIPTSVDNATLRFTLSPSIFNPTMPDYDPLAVQLGIIFVSPVTDIKDLVILDSRRRGGGAPENLSPVQLKSMLEEASFYWDINYGAGMSYQDAGFVVIRLPSQLKEIYSDAFINEVIDRNLTAGVRYKIEDLSGNDW